MTTTLEKVARAIDKEAKQNGFVIWSSKEPVPYTNIARAAIQALIADQTVPYTARRMLQAHLDEESETV